MSSIAAGTTSGTALVSSGDTTGALVLQTNGTTTAVTIATNQVVTLAQPLPVGSGGTGQTTLAAAGLVTLTGTETLTNKTLTNPTITNYVETPYTANSSTAITLALTNGTVQIITLTGTCTITMPTAVSGKSFTILLKTGAGSYTVTWSTVQWPGGTAPTLTSTASKMDRFVFVSDGTYWYGSTAGQNYTA